MFPVREAETEAGLIARTVSPLLSFRSGTLRIRNSLTALAIPGRTALLSLRCSNAGSFRSVELKEEDVLDGGPSNATFEHVKSAAEFLQRFGLPTLSK